jgi:hypothetical protein
MDNSTIILVSSISALAAIVGGLLSGAYQEWRDYREQPKLLLDYEGTAGSNKVDVEYKKGEQQIAEIYIRVRIRNVGRRAAKNCLVFLVGVKEVHPSGLTSTSFYDAQPLAWPGWSFPPRDVPMGVDFYVDLMKVSKHSPGWLISVERHFADQESLKNYSGTYRFQLMATAENAEPYLFEIDVTYDKDWHNLRAVPVTLA